ncbi:LysR family transcriptional regulator [Arthrobacter psychrolactophilus]
MNLWKFLNCAPFGSAHDRGSIAAAAEAMEVTPSSVSQQLAALQRKAGTALTYKLGRRTVLTAAGLALRAATVEVEIALARVDSAVESFKDNATVPVSVAAFHSAGLAFFGPWSEPCWLRVGRRCNSWTKTSPSKNLRA